jgi:protein tyrosine phosphatase (PTP) superfamily phosphohydrolase (DUF442 family)
MSRQTLPAEPFRRSRRNLTAVCRARILALGLLLLVLVLGGYTSKARPRPATWAQRVPSSTLKNWYQLDADVYRSEQPTREGFEEIRAKGIETIINLRDKHSDAPLAEGLGFQLVDVPMTAGGFSEEDIVKALVAIQSAPKPVLVHCQYGADRTGVVMAMYRIVVQGWAKQDALAEMRGGGYGFHWLSYPNIPAFIEKVDVAGIKDRLKIP